MAATIRFNIGDTGTDNQSRSDAVLSGAVSVVNVVPGTTNTLELLSRPVGSAASLSGSTPTWSITPDVVGSYRLLLTASTGDYVIHTLTVKTAVLGLHIPAHNERASIEATVADTAYVAVSETNEGADAETQQKGYATPMAANFLAIEAHAADVANPHATDIENLGGGTLAELNDAISDANVDGDGDSRPPLNHASDHTDGTDDIAEASGITQGLMSIAHHDKLDGIEAAADVTDATNVAAAGAKMRTDWKYIHIPITACENGTTYPGQPASDNSTEPPGDRQREFSGTVDQWVWATWPTGLELNTSVDPEIQLTCRCEGTPVATTSTVVEFEVSAFAIGHSVADGGGTPGTINTFVSDDIESDAVIDGDNFYCPSTGNNPNWAAITGIANFSPASKVKIKLLRDVSVTNGFTGGVGVSMISIRYKEVAPS